MSCYTVLNQQNARKCDPSGLRLFVYCLLCLISLMACKHFFSDFFSDMLHMFCGLMYAVIKLSLFMTLYLLQLLVTFFKMILHCVYL